MNKAKGVYVAAGLLVVAAIVFFAILPAGKKESEILVLCGGSMRTAMREVIKEYRSVSDDKVMLTVGDSGHLASQIRLTRKGDVFVCHDPFMPWAKELGLVDEWRTVARLKVVIAVPKGNPKGVRTLKDLARPGLRVGIGDPKYSTSGVIAKEILKRLEYGEAIRKKAVTTKGHQKRATDVTLGILDATIIWDAVAFLFRDKVDALPIDEKYIDAVTSATFGRTDLRNIKVTIGIITGAKDNERVRRFWEFATTRGREIFARHGFAVTKE